MQIQLSVTFGIVIADECDLNEEVCMIQWTMGSVNYGDELNQGEGFDKATFFFLLTPKYQRSIVNALNSCFNKYNRWSTRMFLVLNNKVNIFIPLTNWIQHSIFET